LRVGAAGLARAAGQFVQFALRNANLADKAFAVGGEADAYI